MKYRLDIVNITDQDNCLLESMDDLDKLKDGEHYQVYKDGSRFKVGRDIVKIDRGSYRISEELKNKDTKSKFLNNKKWDNLKAGSRT